MSSVDNRIVQMKFDNKQFEGGIQTSIKSLDNLKKGLDLDASARSLSNLERAGRNFSLAGIADGVDTLAKRFSNLGIVAMAALANITNSVINTGASMIKSLTIDPVKMGFQEYETKMGAIQTILTNTASKGTKIEDVNKVLNELNTYADQTIYNFSEMTRNIGTFTAAGIDLNTSAMAIKGIANLAAGSGSNAQQASTAMYQLSQAMASGAVKLQDWNSVVNAGMGGELFQKALEKTAKELGHGRDMGVSFRESLQEGWITTEVLTKTLQKFAEDKSLLQAATQVKTFTQLLDTMKESVQSGWAQTWETIIGNKDEAAKALTAVNDVFSSISGSSAKARNDMLAFWKANGGRDMMIQAITNAFNGLMSVLKPIGEAFREVFPAMTGQRLVELTKGIRDLTAEFKIGDFNAANLRSTFKGLFALWDIGYQLIGALVTGFANLIKYILPASNGFLSITGSMGEFLVSLDKAIRTSGIFNVAMEKVGNFLVPIADGVKTLISTIVDTFKQFANIDTSGLDSFSERVRVRFEPFTKLGDLVGTAFSKIADVLQKVAPIFFKLATIIGKAFDKMRLNIVNALDNADFNSIFDIANGGLLAAILYGLKKFIDSLTSITDGGGGLLKNITGILDGVKGSLAAYQSDIKANTLLKIAIAIGILALALIGLALIDSKKLASSLAAMTGMFIELFGAMAIFEKIMGTAGFKGIGKVTLAMVGVSLAILILSSAMTKLAKLDWDGIYKGLIGVAALSAIMVKTAKALSGNTKGLITGSLGLILFATAINILVSAVTKLSKMDTGALAKGLIGVGVLVTELALFMKVTDLSGMGVLKGIGILILAEALVVLSTAVKKISEIKATSLAKALGGIAVMLGEIALFTRLVGDPKGLISTSIGLTILGAAMLIFASALEKMGAMPIEQIGKGLLAMGGALAIIVIALNLMPKDIIGQAAGLVIIASALIILSNALINMGGMSWEQIAKGLVTLAGSLTIIAVAMAFMTTALPGAAALLVVAGALAILTPCLIALGSMSLSEIGKGLLALAGAFTIIGIAGLVLAPITPIILALAGAIALFGLGCIAVGVGMLAFSAGIAALAVSGSAGAAALVLIVTSIVGLIPFMLKTLAQGILDFAKVIGDGAPVISESFMKILIGIIDSITIAAPKIINCLMVLITSMLDALVTAVPKMVDSGMKLILGILKGIADNIASVVAAGVNVIVQFILGVASKLPAIIDAAFKVIISFINGLADAINNNHQAIYNACSNLITAIVNAIADLMPTIIGIGSNIIRGFIKGFTGMATELVRAAKGVIGDAVDGVKKFLGIHSPSRVFAEIGKFSALGFAGGLNDFAGTVAASATNVGATAMDSLRSAISTISDVVSGNMDMNPTIRPVLDLGAVTAGVGTIDSMFNKSRGITVNSANNKTAAITNGFNTSISGSQNGSTNSGSSTDIASSNQPIYVTVVSQLDGREIARVTAPAMSEELYNISRRR